MSVSQCSNPPPEIPREILDKYKKPKESRNFVFKDTDRKTILAEGVVEDVVLIYHARAQGWTPYTFTFNAASWVGVWDLIHGGECPRYAYLPYTRDTTFWVKW
jgi:hypothetical protein